MPSSAHLAYSLNMQLGKRPDTGAYYVRIDGKRISLKAFVGHVVTDNAEAKRVFAQVRREVLAGKLVQFGASTAISLQKFLDTYLEWAEQVREHASFRADKLALNKLADVAGRSIYLDKLTLQHLHRLMAVHKDLRPASINNYMRHIRAAFNKAVEWGHIKTNPFKGMQELTKERRPPVYIEAPDIQRFLASIADVDKRRMVTAYIYTGRRRSELLALRWENVRFDREEYYIGRSKAHLSKWYPMHPIFKAVLLSIGKQRAGKVFQRWEHPDTISHIVKEALEGYGLGHLHLHHMRHTFATLLLSEGVDLAAISDLLGHSDRRATDIYAQVTNTRAHEAIRKIKSGPVEL